MRVGRTGLADEAVEAEGDQQRQEEEEARKVGTDAATGRQAQGATVVRCPLQRTTDNGQRTTDFTFP